MTTSMRLVFVLLMHCLLLACSGSRSSTADTDVLVSEVPTDWPAPVSRAPLVNHSEPFPIEIGVVVFEPGQMAFDERDARHTLRKVETRLATAYLRDVLTESNNWGPVRVLPETSEFAQLTVHGRFVHSDGRDLVLDIEVRDATGRVWMDERLRAMATFEDYTQLAQRDPFRPLFVAVANRLQAQAKQLSQKEQRTLLEVAELRYAADLAPEAFDSYLVENQSRYALARLPADSDPMVARIARIRNQEALFIDTVDEQYLDLRATLGPTYNLWRRSSFEQAEYLEDYTARAADRDLSAPRGSYAAMQQVYSTYRSVRIQEQDLFELASGFDNETAPTVMRSGEQVVRLSGSLNNQYQQWRDILAQIIQLERAALP